MLRCRLPGICLSGAPKSGVQIIPLAIKRGSLTRDSERIEGQRARREQWYGFGELRAYPECRTKSKLQAPGSPARRCGKEVPNGIRRVGDSRALRGGLSYLAYQFQSRGEEKRSDVVQHEVEQAFSLYIGTRAFQAGTPRGVAAARSYETR